MISSSSYKKSIAILVLVYTLLSHNFKPTYCSDEQSTTSPDTLLLSTNPSDISQNDSNISSTNNEQTNISTTILPVEDSNVTIQEIPTILKTMNEDSVKVSSSPGNTIDELPPKAVISSNSVEISDKPKTCTEINRRKQNEQPRRTNDSRLKKCCPDGESLYPFQGPEGGKYCDTEAYPFEPSYISAVLYDNCIEDLEEKYDLEFEVGNSCNVSFIYTKSSGDQIFIMQDGRLLLLDEYGNFSYDIIEDYCLDTDYQTGNLVAVVCVTSIEAHISQGQTILFAVCMFFSVVCLIIVAYMHLAIKELRTLHGLCLGIFSSCLAIGYSLYIYAQLLETNHSKLGYWIQFFMLSYFCWLPMLALNIVTTVWYFLPRYTTITRTIRYSRFTAYFFLAFLIPSILVFVTYQKKLPGMPSYFYQAWSESVHQAQRYFIPPVSVCIILTVLLQIAAYFGIRQCTKIIEIRGGVEYQALRNNLRDDSRIPVLDEEFLIETKKDCMCISILLAINIITWSLEVLTFYSPGADNYLAFMDIMNGFQGVFILLIFVLVRERRDVIVRWWHDRGSHEITPVPTKLPQDVEMQDMAPYKNGNAG